MTIAQPEDLTYETPMQSLLNTFAPDFIDTGYGPTGGSFTSVLLQCDKLKHQIKIEEAILKRLPDHDQPAQQRRIEALYQMVQEGLQYAQARRALEQPEIDRSFNGYHIGDRVLVTLTGGIHGEIKAFEPKFEPTHIVVLMDNGHTTTVPPHRVEPPKED